MMQHCNGCHPQLNTQLCFTPVNALKHTMKQEYQQRPNGVDPTLWKQQLNARNLD